MFLLGRKVRGKSLKNPFGELPSKLDDKVQDDLVIKLREGTITTQETHQLFLSHVRLAICIAGKYAAVSSRREDDMIGEAMAAIGEAIDEAPTKLINLGFTPFCVTKVHSRLSTFLAKDRIAGTPNSSYYHQLKGTQTCRQCGKSHDAISDHPFQPIRESIDTVRVFSLNKFDKTKRELNAIIKVEESDDGIIKRTRFRCNRRLEIRQNIRIQDLKEMLNQAIRSTEEQKVIELRSEGFRDIEIAHILGVSKSKVGLLGARVAQRFEQLEATERDSR